MRPHPSHYQLDLVSLGAGDDATARHAAACDRCAAHLSRLQQPVAVPEWVRDRRVFRGGWPRWPALRAVALAASAMGLLVVAFTWLESPLRRDGEKGAPSIAVYLKRDGAVSRWDERTRVRAGDAIELKVEPREYRRVLVAAIQGGSVTPLFEGSVRGESLVPRSWVIDSSPEPEVVFVAFSRSRLTADALQAAVAGLPHTREVWAARLQFEKEAGRR